MRRLVLVCLGVLSLTVGAETGAAWQGFIPPPPPPPPAAGRDVGSIQGRGTRTVPIGTAEISGVVTSASTGRPLANVRLTLTGQSGVPAPAGGFGGAPGGVQLGAGMSLARTVASDAQGRFVFEALPAGRFILNAVKDQYLALAYGAVKPNRPGTAIPVADGQRVTIAMPMVRGGVISGTVYGPDGDPLSGVQVRAFRFGYNNGFKRPLSTGYAQTDDRGMYRIGNLTSGDYFIGATPSANDMTMMESAAAEAAAFAAAVDAARQGGRTASSVTFVVPPPGANGPPPGFVYSYYPSASTIASASPVAISAGEERSGTDITAYFNRASNINGIVAGIPSPTVAVQVMLLADDPMADVGTPSARTQADGTFTLRGVAPGQYTVIAQVVPAPNFVQMVNGSIQQPAPPPQLEPAQKMWGRAQLVVDGQTLPTVVVTLQPPRSVSGRVEFLTDMPRERRGTVTVTLFPAPSPQQIPQFGPAPQAAVSADGQFTISGVVAGAYSIRASAGPMKSAMFQGQDVLDFPLIVEGDRDVTGLDITIGGQASQLSGLLTDAAGAAVSDCTIVVAPGDRKYWTPGSRRIVITRPGMDGRYTFNGLPSGEYLVAAVTDIEPGSQFDPEFLGNLAAAAVRVTIPDGGKQVQDLRIAR